MHVSKSYDNGTPEKGGTYKVGWEQSFGFTNNFDPTGEYLGNAWGIYVNLLMRSLVGYKHQPGAEGNELIGDLADAVPDATDRGITYTYKLRDGIKFGPPVNRAGHLEGRRIRDEPARQPEGRRAVLLLLHGDQGLAGRRRRQGDDRLRHHDAGRQDDRLPSDEAHGRLQPPHVDAGDGTDPEGSRRLLRGQARRLRPERHLERPVHDQGLGRARSRRAALSSRSAATTAPTATTSCSSATRTTTSRPTSTGRTTRTSSSTWSTRTRTTSTRRWPRASSKTSSRARSRRRSGST